MYKRYGNKFLCFSPPVMLATFAIEFFMLFYVLWRYKMTALTRLSVTFIACLAIFQLAEYMICGGLGMRSVLDRGRVAGKNLCKQYLDVPPFIGRAGRGWAAF